MGIGERLHNLLGAIALAIVLAVAAVTSLLLLVDLAVMKGYPVSGRIGVLGYELNLWGSRIDAPPLDSLRPLGFILAVMDILLVVMVAYTVYADSLYERVLSGLSACSGSAVVAALSHAITRVAYDYIVSLPLGGVIHTSAGNLYLPGSTVYWGLPVKLYLHGLYLLLAIASLATALALGFTYFYTESSYDARG
ncbi:MAG: hypothetical protein F7C33_05410 [Desulfurococcales archaeon]|nr:hypothetical protein [Desulfurococcales archaeon]